MMNKMLDSFINEYKDAFNEYFNTTVMVKIEKREDFREIKDKINEIYNKYPSLRAFIEDEEPASFNQEDTDAFCELYNLFDCLKMIELLEAFKLGGKEALIFFKEQDLLNM